MKLYGLLEKFKSLIGVRQSVAPTPDNNESAFYINVNGDPAYVKDTAGSEVASHLPTASQKVTLTAASASDVAVTIPISGTLETTAGSAGAAAAAVTAHKDLTTGVHGAGTGTLLVTDAIQTLTNKYIDGGTAGSNNKFKLPQDTYANILILTPTEGLVVYATDVDTVFVGDGTNWIAVGSGTGQGRKNYIQNPSASTSASQNWTAVNLTVTKDTSTDIPRETTTGSAFKLVTSGNSSIATFTSAPRLLDDVDKARKLAIELAINVLVTSGWTVDIENSTDGTLPGSWTRIPLSTDSSGATVLPVTSGMFKSSVDMNSARPYVRFVITCPAAVNTVARTAYFSDILLTPDGSTVNSVVVEEWKSYTPTISNVTTSAATGKYRRVGDTMEVNVSFTASAQPTNTVYVALPSGFTVNTNSLSAGANSDSLGHARGQIAGTGWTADVTYVSTTTVAFRSNNTANYWNGTTPGTWVNGNNVSCMFKVPVNEFSGGTVNVAGNDVEYAAAADTPDGDWDDNSTTAVYGQNGTAILGALTGARFKTVTFQSPIQNGDDLVVRLKESGGVWVTAHTFRSSATGQPVISSMDAAGNQISGISIQKSASNAVVVRFSQYMNAANDDSPAANWEAGMRWHVRKVSASSVAGFEMHKPGVSAGLVPAQGLDGRTDGGAPTAGKIGEKITWASAPSSYAVTTSEADWTNASITLTAGTWLIFANLNYALVTGATAGNDVDLYVKITDSSNTLLQNLFKDLRCKTVANVVNAAAGCVSFNAVQVVPPGGATYKVRAYRVDNNGTNSATLYYVNSAYSEFFAVRIA